MGDSTGKAATQRAMSAAALDFSPLVGLRPVRAVTQDEVDTFWRDGVVKLSGILPTPSTDFLALAFEDIFRIRAARDGKGLFKDVWEDNGSLFGDGNRLLGFDFSAQVRELEARGEKAHVLADGGYHEEGRQPAGRYLTADDCTRWHGDLNRWVREGPLPEAIAQLLYKEAGGSSTAGRLRFHNDTLFYKEAGSLIRTTFHQDYVYFNLRGEQVAVCWIPCDVVTKATGAMGYVKGSHLWPDPKGQRPGVIFQPKNFVMNQESQSMKGLIDLPEMPDIERHEADYDVVYFDAEPGDVVVHHVRTVHGSAGNTSSTQHRRAASIRYIGDDVVYDYPAAGYAMAVKAVLSTNTESKHVRQQVARGGKAAVRREEPGGLRPGDPLEGPSFPICWPRDQPSKL